MAVSDPIERVQNYLRHAGQWDDDQAAAWSVEIEAEIEAAFARAAEFPPPAPGEIYDHVFAQPTPTLDRQRRRHLGEGT